MPSMPSHLMFDEGVGVAEDNVAAIAWYRKAAEQGDPQAQNNLGAMYDAGEGTDINDKEAVKWYTLAANQGNTIAQNNLGAMYYSGEGIRASRTEAYKWFLIAGELGNDDARDNQKVAEEGMRRSEISRAQKLADRWLAEFNAE